MAKTPTRRTAPHVAVIDGQPTTTSRDIAETFGKRHDDVLKRIHSLECSPEFSARNFAAAEYIDAQGKPRTEYRITRDGFAFLCMGFTGGRAAQWKERYIATFNRMADKLAAKAARPGELARAVVRNSRATVKESLTPAAPLALPHGAGAQQPTGPDLRAILMHQLPAPAALSRDQQALVDRRAWALAHEAYELLREHIERTVAWRTTEALRATHPHLVERAINGVTLQNALAHPQAEAVAQARDMMRVMVTALTNSAAEVEREWAQSGAKQATGVAA